MIEVHLDLGGYPVTLADTAGLRDGRARAADEVEAEGVAPGPRSASGGRRPQAGGARSPADWRPDALSRPLEHDRSVSLVVLNKADLARRRTRIAVRRRRLRGRRATAPGSRRLVERLALRGRRRAGQGVGRRAEDPGIATASALEDCRAALERARQRRSAGAGAEDLRLALRALGRITGRVDVEDLLDVFFREVLHRQVGCFT